MSRIRDCFQIAIFAFECTISVFNQCLCINVIRLHSDSVKENLSLKTGSMTFGEFVLKIVYFTDKIVKR